MQICTVCTKQEPKYRCPACKIRYCSVACYKNHKDACLPGQPTSSEPKEKKELRAEPWTVEDLLHVDDIIDKVPIQKLELLGQSTELRDLLCNPHLRRLLQSIDAAERKDHAMKAAMQEPLFVEFSDQCLNILENKSRALYTHEGNDS